MASHITGVSIVCSTICSGADQRKHQSFLSLAFVRRFHRWPVDSPNNGPVTRKMIQFDDVIMIFRAMMPHYWLSMSALGQHDLVQHRTAMDCHGHNDDVIKWKHFPRYWPFVRGIPRSPVNSPHKGHWRGALMFSLICARINGWVNNREAGDLRRHRGHYDVNVM